MLKQSSHLIRSISIGVISALLIFSVVALLAPRATAAVAQNSAIPPAGMPIQHIIVIFQENHTFDSMFGPWCGTRCNGATSGQAGTTTVPLTPATDIVPPVDHSVSGQATATDGGRMDGFSKIQGCTAPSYACYSYATSSEIPNLLSLAQNYAISDNTYALKANMSWEQHMQLGSLTSDGFYGNNPVKDPTLTGGTGWGCISPDQAKWGPTQQYVPPCIPDRLGAGPRKPSPVQWVPNFYVDDLAANNVSYKLYGALYESGSSDNIWCAGCMFWSWRGSSQYTSTGRRPHDILTDLSTGNLPQYSLVTPNGQNSQHNNDSLTTGDNWIGSVVNAVKQSPYWASTAIVIGYDDCGCFYDHVSPPPGMGMRTPLVIVSPYAKAGFTDTTQASFASGILSLSEWVFGLPPLTSTSSDNGAYHWQNSFNFSQTPLAAPVMHNTTVPASSVQWLKANPTSNQASPDS